MNAHTSVLKPAQELVLLKTEPTWGIPVVLSVSEMCALVSGGERRSIQQLYQRFIITKANVQCVRSLAGIWLHFCVWHTVHLYLELGCQDMSNSCLYRAYRPTTCIFSFEKIHSVLFLCWHHHRMHHVCVEWKPRGTESSVFHLVVCKIYGSHLISRMFCWFCQTTALCFILNLTQVNFIHEA